MAGDGAAGIAVPDSIIGIERKFYQAGEIGFEQVGKRTGPIGKSQRYDRCLGYNPGLLHCVDAQGEAFKDRERGADQADRQFQCLIPVWHGKCGSQAQKRGHDEERHRYGNAGAERDCRQRAHQADRKKNRRQGPAAFGTHLSDFRVRVRPISTSRRSASERPVA